MTESHDSVPGGTDRPVAIVTGISRGLGRAVAAALLSRGWTVAGDARRADDLKAVTREVESAAADADSRRRHRFVTSLCTGRRGGESRLALLIRQQRKPARPQSATHAGRVSVARSAGGVHRKRIRPARPDSAGAAGVDCSTWSHRQRDVGCCSRAVRRLGWLWLVESGSGSAVDGPGRRSPGIPVYAFDPGDMRTEMHQAAFPGENISDRPEPESVVPALFASDRHPPRRRSLPRRRPDGQRSIVMTLRNPAHQVSPSRPFRRDRAARSARRGT